MLKYTLIYLWIYVGIHHGAMDAEAGDADEHVHIKLHMPKTAVRKSLHRNHVRHKKNPPPYVPSTPHGPGTAIHSQHSVYNEAPPHHNYLTGMGTQSLHGLHHHMKKHTSPMMTMTHLQPMGGTGNGGQQQLLDAQFYASPDGTGSTAAAELGGLLGDTDGGDYMAYLTKSFASFPQPTFETEILSTPMANGDMAYQQAREEEEEEQEDYRNQHQQHYTAFKHHHHRQPYEMAAGNHELDEDNEILGPLGRTSSVMEQSEWSPQHQHPAKLYRGGLSSSTKALKNEHLLRHVMHQQQQHLYPDVDNNQDMQSLAIQRSRNHYRDDKLYKETVEKPSHDAIDVMNTYEDMDMDTVAHRDGDDDVEGRHGGLPGAGTDGGIKPLTVDDIWSQLQRTYLNKYTPQAQPNEMLAEEQESTSWTPSKKHKRNSQKIKTRKRNYQSKAATPTTSAPAATVRTLSYENNYYNQEQQGKPSTFYDNHTPQSSSYGSSYVAFSPFSSSYSTSSAASSPAERDFHNTRATSATRPSYQNFKTFSNFDETAVAGGANTEDDEDAFASSDDVSSEESAFSSSHKKYGNNRSHRHNHGSVAYGHADTLNNNPFNYQDLYASYSTPIAQATIATYPNYQASTYHPNSYNAGGPTPSSSYSYSSSSSSSSSSTPSSSSLNPQTPHQQPAQAIYPTGHESTSYQWREQQHYPASYQSYHTSSSHHQQQQRPQQQQQHLQQPHPHTQQYQPQTSNTLRLPKATAASASSASLSHQHPLAAGASSSSSSSLSSSPLSPLLSTNDFTSAVKQSSIAQQQRNKKRKNRSKSKRNRIVVT